MPGILDNARFRKLLLSYPTKAIELLYQHYDQNLFLLAKSLTQDPQAAQDIVQETFLHIWENRKRLAEYHDRSIEHYLVRVVKFKSITYYKNERQRNEKKIAYLRGQVNDNNVSSIEDMTIRNELINEVRSAIDKFPKREKECLLMKLEDELSNRQIAEKLKVSVKAVERSITSAHKRLKEIWLAKKQGVS